MRATHAFQITPCSSFWLSNQIVIGVFQSFLIILAMRKQPGLIRPCKQFMQTLWEVNMSKFLRVNDKRKLTAELGTKPVTSFGMLKKKNFFLNFPFLSCD